MNTFERGCLAWPATRPIKGFVEYDLTVERLGIIHFYGDDVMVEEVEPVPPILAMATGHVSTNRLLVRTKGQPLKLMDFHSARGFASLSEASLRQVYVDYALELPDCTTDDQQS